VDRIIPRRCAPCRERKRVNAIRSYLDAHDLKLPRVLTDHGSEHCGNPERYEYKLYLAVEDIDHSRTKTNSPQTNGICEPMMHLLDRLIRDRAVAISAALFQ
jgi:hypothetical protein